MFINVMQLQFDLWIKTGACAIPQKDQQGEPLTQESVILVTIKGVSKLIKMKNYSDE